MRFGFLAALVTLGVLITVSAATAAPVTFSGTVTYGGTYSGDSVFVAVVDTLGPTAFGFQALAAGAPPLTLPYSVNFDNAGAPPSLLVAAVLDVDGSGFDADSLDNAITDGDVLGWYPGQQDPVMVDPSSSQSGLSFALPTGEVHGNVIFATGQTWAEIEAYSVPNEWSPATVKLSAPGAYSIIGLYAGGWIVEGYGPFGIVCHGDPDLRQSDHRDSRRRRSPQRNRSRLFLPRDRCRFLGRDQEPVPLRRVQPAVATAPRTPPGAPSAVYAVRKPGAAWYREMSDRVRDPRDREDPDEPFSAAEEVANSLTHGAGLLLGIAALILMVVFAAKSGSAIRVVASSVYGTTLVLLYGASTFYHALPPGRGKRIFGILDHAAIFLLIAGTYTPFTLVTLRGGWGWSLFGVIWGLAAAGVVLEAVSRGRARRFQLALYLVMGWIIVVAARPLLAGLRPEGLVLLLAGGLAYTLGVAFFVWRRLPFHHAVWHVFVLGGSICHFFAVLLYVIP